MEASIGKHIESPHSPGVVLMTSVVLMHAFFLLLQPFRAVILFSRNIHGLGGLGVRVRCTISATPQTPQHHMTYCNGVNGVTQTGAPTYASLMHVVPFFFRGIAHHRIASPKLTVSRAWSDKCLH
jgi:hypothetical protein